METHYLQRGLSQTPALLLKPTLSRHTLKFPVLPELPFVFFGDDQVIEVTSGYAS